MFTGIVTSMGTVAAVSDGGGARRIAVETGAPSSAGWKVGDSVAVSGVCLTLVTIAPGRFEADLSGETLARTTLGRLTRGSRVNLESALSAGDALGGHLVTGHVDGVATARETREEGGALRVAVEAPGLGLNIEVDLLARYLDRLVEARGIR
jgi:riboflavin synthase